MSHPPHITERINRLETENVRLSAAVDALRAQLADAVSALASSRAHAFRWAAGAAKGYGEGMGDRREFVSVTSLEIHDLIAGAIHPSALPPTAGDGEQG